MNWIIGALAVTVLVVGACTPEQQPQRQGPASLDLVPPSYYSSRPPPARARPIIRRDDPVAISLKPRGQRRIAAQTEAPANSPSGEEINLDDIEARAEDLAEQLRAIRRRLLEQPQ